MVIWTLSSSPHILSFSSFSPAHSPSKTLLSTTSPEVGSVGIFVHPGEGPLL